MKKTIFILLALITLFSVQFVSAASLSITSTPVVGTIVNDADVPAIFDIKVTNLGAAGNFEMFSFERFQITPNKFTLSNGETKTIRVNFLPVDSMKKNIGHINTPVFFRVEGESDTQQHDIVIKLVDYGKLFDVSGQNVNIDSKSVVVSFYNLEDMSHNEVNLVFSSAFFEGKQLIGNLKPYEKKDLTVPINEEKIKKLLAGTYTITATYTIDGRSSKIDGIVKILEKSGLSVNEDSSGFIIRSNLIEKTNEGNIPTVAEINVRKNILSRLFTTFSQEPLRVERKGAFVDYTWQKELAPSETLRVKVTTNLIFPLLLVIAIVVIVYIFNVYVTGNLVIRKRVSFVKTKTGEFALKITLNVKARKFIEKVKIYDRLPAMSKLYENFGTTPDKFNHHNGIIQWEIPRLAAGEERVYSYVIYSKLRVVGKFELPSATGIYEMEGRMHEVKSNRSFFINDAKESKEDFVPKGL